MGEFFGLDGFYMKDVSRNPVGWHKDRLESLLISKAHAVGAKGITIGRLEADDRRNIAAGGDNSNQKNGHYCDCYVF